MSNPDTITSVQNPLIKETVKLQRKKERDEAGLLLVETRHPIEEAIANGLTMKHWFKLENATSDQVPEFIPMPAVLVTEEVMKKLCTTDSPPPCVGVFEKENTETLPDLDKGVVLILDSLQDPGNLGTLIRSAAAFNVRTIITTGNTVDAFSPKVIRASAGLVFRMFMFEGDAVLDTLATTPPPIYWATHTADALPYTEAAFSKPCALLLGSEGTGIRDELKTKLTLTPITIPMAPGVDSLNVAVSGSILLAQSFLAQK